MLLVKNAAPYPVFFYEVEMDEEIRMNLIERILASGDGKIRNWVCDNLIKMEKNQYSLVFFTFLNRMVDFHKFTDEEIFTLVRRSTKLRLECVGLATKPEWDLAVWKMSDGFKNELITDETWLRDYYKNPVPEIPEEDEFDGGIPFLSKFGAS